MATLRKALAHLKSVGVDIEANRDVVEPVANLGISTEDPEDVHVSLDGCGHGPELDLAILSDSCNACGETTRQP